MTPRVINRLTSSPAFFQRPAIEIDHSHDFSGQLFGSAIVPLEFNSGILSVGYDLLEFRFQHGRLRLIKYGSHFEFWEPGFFKFQLPLFIGIGL